jgi:hypothetical protein
MEPSMRIPFLLTAALLTATTAYAQTAPATTAPATRAGARGARAGRGPQGPAPTKVLDGPDASIANIPVNYTESKVGTFTLPDPLTLNNGQKVTDAATFNEKRRPEILALLAENQYGKTPPKPADLSFDTFDKGTPAFDGKATRKQTTIHLTKDKDAHNIELLEYLPAKATGPVPLLLCINFSANNSMVPNDPGVKVGQTWDARNKKYIPATAGRGLGSEPIADLIDAGFGVAMFNYADVEPDALDSTVGGIRATYLKPGEKEPAPDEWGAISAWAWGMSCAIDYFETDPQVDAKRIAIYGVSRLGKTVTWEGAREPRVALVIASCGGEGGAALSRRNYGETIAHLVAPSRFPYQFAGNYAKWAKDPNTSPVDGHMLLACIAPRPILLQTGTTDGWSDPKGEFESAVAAAPVYKLFGKDPLDTTTFPDANQPILHDLGYFMHAGGHGTMPTDWPIFIQFMQKHLK